MWKLDCEEGWAPKNWCFWTVVLEKTLVSPLDCKEIQPVHSEGDQPCVSFGRNDAKAETPILWPPHAKSWLIGKNSDAGRDWGQEENGTTEDEMAGWHHWLDGRESGWTPGVGDRQGGLACCNSWDHKESDTTERLNWTELNWTGELILSSNSSMKETFFLFFIILHFTCKKTEMKGVSLLTHPLQCSCLENPRDRGAWWAAIYGVAQSQTRLKQLSRSSSSSRLLTHSCRAKQGQSHDLKRKPLSCSAHASTLAHWLLKRILHANH